MITATTIAHYNLTPAAVDVLAEVGMTDADVFADFARVVAENGGRRLLCDCTEGADDDRFSGWSQYVGALVSAVFFMDAPVVA